MWGDFKFDCYANAYSYADAYGNVNFYFYTDAYGNLNAYSYADAYENLNSYPCAYTDKYPYAYRHT